VRKNQLTREEADLMLAGVASKATGVLWPPSNGRRVDGRSYYLIDTSGDGSCSSSQEDLVEDAVNFIASNLGDITTSCIINATNYCASGGKLSCFGGHAPTNNPHDLVDDTIHSSHFRVKCNSCTFRSGTGGYTNCGQWNDTYQDIHLCNSFLSWATAEQLACIIVHEIMHVWGADENAAYYMSQGALPWDCP
jgi:hypothetical protein